MTDKNPAYFGATFAERKAARLARDTEPDTEPDEKTVEADDSENRAVQASDNKAGRSGNRRRS